VKRGTGFSKPVTAKSLVPKLKGEDSLTGSMDDSKGKPEKTILIIIV
jgi:hypothetical protein